MREGRELAFWKIQGMMKRIYHKPFKPSYIVEIARRLRKKATETEKLLWEILRNRKLEGYKFRRQVPYGRYIYDFYCAEKKMAIEIDGGSHKGKEEYDKNRDEYVSAGDVRLIRFTNDDINKRFDIAVTRIKALLNG